MEDAPINPHQLHSTVLTIEQEAMIVAFRQNTLLPLDDCLYALQPSIPNLTRLEKINLRRKLWITKNKEI